jgi:hypothetical protein
VCFSLDNFTDCYCSLRYNCLGGYEMNDSINHPKHYAETVPGIECIEVTQHFNINRGNAIKYIWRAGHKNDEIEDLKKAIQYLNFEIQRIEHEKKRNSTVHIQER